MVNGSLLQSERNSTVSASLAVKQESLNPLLCSKKTTCIVFPGTPNLRSLSRFRRFTAFKNLASVLEVVRMTVSLSVWPNSGMAFTPISSVSKHFFLICFIPILVSFAIVSGMQSSPLSLGVPPFFSILFEVFSSVLAMIGYFLLSVFCVILALCCEASFFVSLLPSGRLVWIHALLNQCLNLSGLRSVQGFVALCFWSLA